MPICNGQFQREPCPEEVTGGGSEQRRREMVAFLGGAGIVDRDERTGEWFLNGEPLTNLPPAVQNTIINNALLVQRANSATGGGGGAAGGATQTYLDQNGALVGIDRFGNEIFRREGAGEATPPFFVQNALRQNEILQGQQFQADQTALGQAFQNQQGLQAQNFTEQQNALQRAQQAEQFAQSITLQRKQLKLSEDQFLFQVFEAQANRVAQARRDRVAAAGQLAQVISMADPLAQQVFGSNVQGAIAGGAEALTANAIEPAAQIQSTLSGNPVEQARQTILDLRRNTQIPTLFSNHASGDDLGLQNVGIQNQAPGTIQGFLNSVQAKTGASTGLVGNEINRRAQQGVKRRSISLTSS